MFYIRKHTNCYVQNCNDDNLNFTYFTTNIKTLLFSNLIIFITSIRFHGMMNKDLPTHPTIFLFMTQLRCYVYQQGITTVVLNQAGLNKPTKSTLAAQKLTNRAKEVEEKYLQGLMTPTEVLQHAASHYADNTIQDSLIRDSQATVKQTYERTNDDDDISQSQDPALTDPEFEDERRTALEADEGLTDMGTDDWILAHWTSPGNLDYLPTTPQHPSFHLI